MSDSKVSDLDPITTLASDDLLYAVDISGGNSGSKSITALDGATTLQSQLSYTSGATGAQPASAKEIFDEKVSALRVVPEAQKAGILDGTTTYDAFSVISALDAWAGANNKTIVFPPGTTWRFESGFNPIDGTQIQASWDFSGAHFKFDLEAATEPRILSLGNNTLNRPNRLDETPAAGAEHAALNDQPRPGCTVFLSNPGADASKFAIGDYVFISCGIDIYDADADIWGFTFQTYIVDINAGTGEITLADAIPVRLDDRGWAPSSAKNTASDWANSTSYSSGDYVYGGAGSAKPTALWEAISSGTSSGTAPDDDTGVSWIRRTNDLDSLRNNRDGRPVIQLVPDPVANRIIRAGIIENISATRKCQQFFSTRTAYNCLMEGAVARGASFNTFSSTESSNHNRFLRVHDHTDPRSGSPDFRGLNTGSSWGLIFEDCRLQGNLDNGTDAAVYLEAAGELTLRNTDVYCAKKESVSPATVGITVASGRLAFDGGDISGFSQPVSHNQADQTIIPDTDEIGQEIVFWHPRETEWGARNFRRFGNVESPATIRKLFQMPYGITIFDTYQGGSGYDQKPRIRLINWRMIEYKVEFNPAANQTNTVVTLDPALVHGILPDASGYVLGDQPIVVLGAMAYWSSVPASATATIQIEGTRSGVYRDLLRSSNPGLTLSDSIPRAIQFDGNGGTERTLDPSIGEQFAIRYDSNASAGGGTITVVTTMLVQDYTGGDFRAF